MTKKVENTMEFEKHGSTKPSKGSTRRYIEKEMDNLNMWSIGWYAVKRCRLGISVGVNLCLIYVQFHKFIG